MHPRGKALLEGSLCVVGFAGLDVERRTDEGHEAGRHEERRGVDPERDARVSANKQ